LLLAAIPALGMGCDASELDPSELGSSEHLRFGSIGSLAARGRGVVHSSPGGGGWINNGLSDPNLSGIDPGFPLSSPQGMSEEEGVLVDENKRITARYLVECALTQGSEIVKLVDDEEIVLEGYLGLAPAWEDGACDDDCQQWVSACMLARTNVSGLSISISLRAEHPALGFEGNPHYPIYEASFFGNLFVPETQYLCEGSEQAIALAQLSGRTCSSDPESCGFEAYDDCEEQDRCAFVEQDGDPTAIDCVPEGSDTPYHTISVYLAEPDGDDEGYGGYHGTDG
jgi:hypothetical protein